MLIISLEGRAHRDLAPSLAQCESLLKVCRVTALQIPHHLHRLPLQPPRCTAPVFSPSLRRALCASSDVGARSSLLVPNAYNASSLLPVGNFGSILKIWLRHSVCLFPDTPGWLGNVPPAPRLTSLLALVTRYVQYLSSCLSPLPGCDPLGAGTVSLPSLEAWPLRPCPPYSQSSLRG